MWSSTALRGIGYRGEGCEAIGVILKGVLIMKFFLFLKKADKSRGSSEKSLLCNDKGGNLLICYPSQDHFGQLVRMLNGLSDKRMKLNEEREPYSSGKRDDHMNSCDRKQKRKG